MKKECHVCTECDGSGTVITLACCGHFIAPFECCCNPIPEQSQCEHCRATGQIEVEVIRHTGYYWVRLAGSWVIAYYDNEYDGWNVITNDAICQDDEFEIISDRLIIRGEVEALEEKIRDIRANN